ncbi:hypothetical protein [Marinobacter sp. V034]|uniref:hypothetical protein n=1 Tax=Marinobacter sp. V034 TaxID=3459610 RepID=UPI004044D2AE
MREENSTFHGSSPAWANACVGDNGSPSYVEYALGFSKAANFLIDKVVSSRGIGLTVDDLVYPVCFNMRHSVELRLKGAISELQKIARIKGVVLNFDLVRSHDIGNVWGFFKQQSESFDSRYEVVNSKIEPIILDIADIDATGQTFRYPTDKESQRHLTNVALINFFVLKEKFSRLEENLNELLEFNDYLLEEYYLSTFTSKLSRQQLFKIAEDLPEINLWRNEGFREKKLELREKYSITSNDLTKAINIIKSNYELAYKVGRQLPLRGLDEYDLIWFLDFWIKINPEIKNKSNDSKFMDMDVDSIMGSLEIDDKAKIEFWVGINGQLTPTVLAGLRSLFYFARDKKFSETYVFTYQRELRAAEMRGREGIEGIKESFMHLVDKENFFDNLVLSLCFLHYGELAKELIEIYGVYERFNWLDKARSRSIFALPELAGY